MHKHWAVLWAVLLLILTFSSVGADENTDLLLVNVSGNQGENIALSLYNPVTNESTSLLDNSTYTNVTMSADGRLAYSSSFEGRMTAHILDTNHLDQLVEMVTDVGAADEYPLAWSPDGHRLVYESIPHQGYAALSVWDGEASVDVTPQSEVDQIMLYINVAWSPDGHYLAYQSYHSDTSGRMYVWDGTTSIDITPQAVDDRIVYYDKPVWSANSRLAFTMHYGGESVSEIYVWDGHNTMNVSQNPSGNDLEPAWSADGRLAFQSERDSALSIQVWDGTSLKNNLPDTSTFVTVAPDLYMGYYSFPVWTSAESLAFPASASGDQNPQIYIWDGQTTTEVSHNPDVTNGYPVWNHDGRWAYSGHSAAQEFLYVRDADNQSLLMNKGAFFYKPAWSSTGDLAFCRWDAQEWVMSVWDGQTVREVASGPHVHAQWQSGTSVDCFSG
jgi:Tol biopolymer transport system component